MDLRLESYIESHIDPEPPHLRRINRAANLRLVIGRMASGHVQGRLLKMLTQMINPRKALELGTFAGYSALCIAEGMADDAELHTVEIDDELEDFIRGNLCSDPCGRKVTLHIGDAVEVIGGFADGELDMVFIDADKREYTAYYEAVKPKVRRGGYIIADNTLWDGHVVEQSKHSPQTAGVLAFNALVAADSDVEKVIVPLRDGLTLIRKK